VRKIVLIILTVSWPLFALPQQAEFMQKFSSGRPHLREEVNRVPFKLAGHKIYLRASVNGSGDFDFILDTGALTVIDETVARELDLERGVAVPSLDTVKSAFICRDRVKIDLGDVWVDGFIPMITDLPDADSTDPGIDGFIGSDFLRFFCLTINYQERELIFSSENFVPSNPIYTIKMKKFFPLGFPMIDAVINDSGRTAMMIDTGSPFSIVCPISMIEDGEMFRDQTVLKSNGTFMKWPSTTKDYNYLSCAKSLRFGDYDIRNIPLYFAELPRQFSSPLIGKDFLDNFIVTVDYIHDLVILEPSGGGFGGGFEDGLFSIGLAVRKEGDRVLVRGVWQNAPADRNGIQVGDEVLTLNGRPAEDMSLDEITAILKDDNFVEVVLRVRNEAGAKDVVVGKERVIGFGRGE
jgi:hypothetical protein